VTLAVVSLTLYLTTHGKPLSSQVRPNFSNNNPELGQFFEGDIMGVKVDAKGALAVESFLVPRWTNGVVPYDFDPEAGYTDEEKDIILSGMKHVEDKTRHGGKYCVKFVPHTNEPYWITIYNGPGCASHLGMQPDLMLLILGQGNQFLSLMRPDPNVPGSRGCVHLGVVAHEFLHALGQWHEQSRPDRDEFIDINWENMPLGAIPQFIKQDPTLVNMTDPYDYDSLMHYEHDAFSNNGLPTIVPKDGNLYKIGNRSGMSTIDITEIRRMYNCPGV